MGTHMSDTMSPKYMRRGGGRRWPVYSKSNLTSDPIRWGLLSTYGVRAMPLVCSLITCITHGRLCVGVTECPP